MDVDIASGVFPVLSAYLVKRAKMRGARAGQQARIVDFSLIFNEFKCPPNFSLVVPATF